MKKILPLLITAALLCTGCQSQNNDSDNSAQDTASSPKVSTAANEVISPADGDEAPVDSIVSEDSEPSETLKRFETGTWLLYQDDIPLGYGFAYEANEAVGLVYTYDTGLSYEFTYVIGENKVDFTCGGKSATFDITGGDPAYIEFRTPEGEEFSATYLNDSMPDEILGNFYSNPQLCEIALDYYEKEHGYRPTSCAATTNADGTVKLHLYDNMETHIATLARYTVDRTSCAGTEDILCTEINLLA